MNARPSAPSTSTLDAPRVLVAEDDPDLLEVVTAVLRHDGCHVTQARSGDELLELLATYALFDSKLEPPDLVLTDVRLPGASGLEILRAAERAGRGIPFILMTGFAEPSLREAAADHGTVVLEKPFGWDRLRREVRKVVG